MPTNPSTTETTTESHVPAVPKQADQASAWVSGLDALERRPQLTDAESNLRRWLLKLWNATWPKLLAIAIVIGAWQIVYLSQWRPSWALPSPMAVFEDMATFIPTAEFWQAIGITMQRALTGFALALLIGTVIGVAVSRFKPLRAAIGSLITGLQTMPSIMWFPFAILLFQISEAAIMFVVILGAVPSIANGLISGIDYVPPAWKRVGTMLGMRGFGLYRHVILPASLPSFVSGLKQGWAFAWRSLMAGELLVIIAGQGSIGALMQGAREFNNAPRVLTWIIVVLTIGIIVDMIFKAIDSRLRRTWGLTSG
ncbi:ABC transporter permease [Natronoglycomyces albus]|uniref:ABC transporter permease n=1 Tax=Natronoglycomyces albus TaxID=2811108 RepID=A0A895XRJ9_9ACTN|nr:ABC transporter permease [Natronoglycomyces albus]QSB05969.1 ABC transporter permease [Natronoglycomyces albus]